MTDYNRADLVALAAEARQRAYAPYSQFTVGAALLGRSGKVYLGCNVENVSYGLSVCAERAAVFRAIGEGEREFIAIAVVTENGVTPCGACRQVLQEFNDGSMEVVVADAQGRSRVYTLAELLPAAVIPADLKQG